MAMMPASAEIIGCACVLTDATALTTEIIVLPSAAVSLKFFIFVLFVNTPQWHLNKT